MKQLIKKVKQISMLLLVISIIGCENDDVLLPEVISSFTYTINADTGTVTFINTSVNSRNYFWEFGDGTSSTLKNPINNYTAGEYTVTLKAINVAGAFDTSEAIIVISDVGAPIITLLGDTTINIMVGGDPYVDPGATATDDVDGDLTANIVVVGVDAVDVNTAATYTITYNVSDAAGNAATERTRTVIVAADIVAPVITLTGSATMNITIGDTFTDPGATATDDVDGDITANIVVAGDTVDVNTAGTYTITYNVSDASGNAATEVTRTVIVADPNACVADTAQSFAAGSFNISFETDPGTTETVGETGKLFLGDVGYEYLDNPDLDNAVNSSCKVAKIEKASGFNYANVQIFTADKFNFTDNAGFKLKIFSPNVGTNVLFKLEDTSNGGINNQVSQLTTIANGWEELTFDFPESDTNKFDRIIIFFGFEQGDALIVHFDDLALYGTGGGGGGGGGGTTCGLSNNGDFEAGNLDGWAVYENGGIIIADNTENNGGNWSSKIVASAPSGLNPTLKQERKGAGTLAVGDIVEIKFDYKGSSANGGVYDIRSFVEAGDGVNQTEIFAVTPTDTWQSFTTTYTVNAGDISGGITLQFTAICGGVAGCTSTLYLDNICISINP